IIFEYQARTDNQGHFAFERVIPGPAAVSRAIPTLPNHLLLSPWVHIEVEPGQTARVRLGGMGRPVVGRAVKPAGSKVSLDWTNSSNHFQLKPPPINEPKNMNKEQRAAWYKAWITTEEGKAHLAYLRDPRFYAFRVERDGSFRIDDVIPGPYELTFWLGDGR